MKTLIAFILLIPAFARAASTPPPGINGQIIYNKNGLWGAETSATIPQGGTNSSTASDALVQLSGVYNASSCGTSFKPAWCSGSDIGAWINAAIAFAQSSNVNFPVKVVVDPTQGPYTYSTTIVVPLNVDLDCQRSELDYSPSSGAALVLGSGSNNLWYTTPVENCAIVYLAGYTAGNTNVGVFVGGDPAGVYSSPNSFGPNKPAKNLTVTGFYKGVTWGNNAWAFVFEGLNSPSNYNNVYAPKTAASASVTAFSISSNVVTLTANNSATTGQTLNIQGLTTGTYLNNVALTVASANSTQITANFTHANVSNTSDSGTAYTNGVYNSGESIRFMNSNISNALNCGYYGVDANMWVTYDNVSSDYNTNGEFCGTGLNVNLDGATHLERTSGPFFNFPSTSSLIFVRGSGVVFAYAGLTGTDQGLIVNYDVSSIVNLKNPIISASHAITNWVYTNAHAVNVCIDTPLYEQVVGGNPNASDNGSGPSCSVSGIFIPGSGFINEYNFGNIASVSVDPALDTNANGGRMCHYINGNDPGGTNSGSNSVEFCYLAANSSTSAPASASIGWTELQDIFTVNKTNGGRVGIGTTNPGSKLSVVGLGTTSPGTGGGYLCIDSAGDTYVKASCP